MKKTSFYVALWVAFAAGCISLRAQDNPAQAAARAALVKLLMDSNKPPAPAAPTNSPARGKSSWDVAQPSGETVTAKTNTAPRTKPVEAVPVAVTPAIAPAAPVKARPAAVPATPAPAPAMAVVKNTPPPAQPKPGKDIVTIYGTVYKNAEVEKVDPDGVIISYSTSNGGLGMTKVDFKDLSVAFRDEYQK